MNSVNELLRPDFEQLRQEVIAAYNNSGQAATGNWADSVQIIELPNGFSLTADDYINGRGPGKPPPSSAIEQWLINKGIAARISKDISIGSLAFLIARKIARNGWQPKPGTVNPVEAVVTPQRIQQLLDKAAGYYTNDFCSTIINYLKPVA